MPNRFVPVDHAIVGFVDAVETMAGGGPPAGPTDAPREPSAAGAPSRRRPGRRR
jgi:hypothetical protein